MERRNFIKSSLGIGLGATLPGMTHSKSGKEAETAVSPAMPVKSGKPHIILIMTDQQRGDALGCMGNKAVISPNIDRLAQEGSLFVSGYSSAPSSTPGRAGLLTGMSPWHHGMLGYGRMALKYRYEMPQMMRNLGYYTFGIGKMHWFPQKALHGFHATLIDESGRGESPDFISDYREWFQLQAPGKDPDLTGIGWNDHAAGVYKLDERLHPTAWTGQTACELIRNYDNDKPLFLKVSFARPHSPYDPPQRYLDMYKDADIPKPHIGDWCGQYAEPKDPLQGASDAPFGNFGDAYAINSRRHYYANITFIDDQVGQIIQTLKDKGMYDNALICFTADHGDMLGDHYHWRKTYPYEGSAHIPYIVKWPAGISKSIPDGSSIEQPSQTITANRKWHYLMNPQFNSAGGSVNNPCFTLIARMDKMPPYLVATESGRVAIEIYETDSPMTRKIKEFMALYGIVDIKMRMLRIPELKRIMGFPEDYVLVGTQADQKKFIGNAVEVTQAKKNTEALCKRLRVFRLNKLKEAV